MHIFAIPRDKKSSKDEKKDFISLAFVECSDYPKWILF